MNSIIDSTDFIRNTVQIWYISAFWKASSFFLSDEQPFISYVPDDSFKDFLAWYKM